MDVTLPFLVSSYSPLMLHPETIHHNRLLRITAFLHTAVYLFKLIVRMTFDK